MNFFIDNNLSPKLKTALTKSGFDVVHARDYDMQEASDKEIFIKAKEENRTIVSADTDFGFILAKWEESKPSLILFRQFSPLAGKQKKAIEFLAKEYKSTLEEGSVIVVEPKGIRIRELPLY